MTDKDDHKCPKCGLYLEPTEKDFEPGMRVQMVVSTPKRKNGGLTTQYKVRNAKIISVGRISGEACIRSGGKEGVVSLRFLTPAGWPSPISRALFGACNCEPGKTG